MVRLDVMIVLIAVLVGCVGKTEVTGPPEGTCSLSNGTWSCVADDAGASPEAGPSVQPALVLPQCPSSVGGGACSDSDQTIDTTNSTMPAHHSNGDCFQCTSDGLGIHWTCVSGSWQSQGVYSCQ